jgi:hypothetical protein
MERQAKQLISKQISVPASSDSQSSSAIFMPSHPVAPETTSLPEVPVNPVSQSPGMETTI